MPGSCSVPRREPVAAEKQRRPVLGVPGDMSAELADSYGSGRRLARKLPGILEDRPFRACSRRRSEGRHDSSVPHAQETGLEKPPRLTC